MQSQDPEAQVPGDFGARQPLALSSSPVTTGLDCKAPFWFVGHRGTLPPQSKVVPPALASLCVS